jgi:methyl-accepting chemotaxis protein
MLMLPAGPLIVSSLPLRTTDGGGPSTGTIVFARYLDSEKIGEIGEITHLSIQTFRYDAADIPEDVADAKKVLMDGATHVVSPVSAELVRGYMLLPDIHGNPALIVRIESPRPIYAQGQLSFVLFMTIGGVAILLFGIVMYLLLERLVITRFVRLSKDVEKINSDKDLSIRVDGGIKDEIGKLAEKINQMLGWLSEAREAEAASRREIISLLDEQKQAKEQREEMERLAGLKPSGGGKTLQEPGS